MFMHTISATPRLIRHWKNELPKLLPCPCCGKDAEYRVPSNVKRLIAYAVVCTGCHLQTDFFITPNLANIKWNHRQ